MVVVLKLKMCLIFNEKCAFSTFLILCTTFIMFLFLIFSCVKGRIIVYLIFSSNVCNNRGYYCLSCSYILMLVVNRCVGMTVYRCL